MKLFFSEFKADYNNYHFPYQVWLLKEDGDDEEKIYGNGFLPIRNLPNVYYLSRSTRVDLEKFELSSENRRILGKTNDFTVELKKLSDFVYSPQIQKFCKDYADQKLGKSLLSTETIKGIFTNGIFSHVFIFKDSEMKEIGYAVCLISKNIIQYGFSFYDLGYFKQSLGARMMLEAVSWAKENQKKYIYLGTCYEQTALYKTEFKGIEFFNGFRWSDNLDELKRLVAEQSNEYLLKNNKYLEEFYSNDLTSILSKYGVRVSF